MDRLQKLQSPIGMGDTAATGNRIVYNPIQQRASEMKKQHALAPGDETKRNIYYSFKNNEFTHVPNLIQKNLKNI